MKQLIDDLIDSSGLANWLLEHNLGWLINEKTLDALGLIIGSVLVYYIGGWLIIKGLRQIIRNTARQQSWHQKDTDKREKTLVGLIRSFWRIMMLAYVIAMLAHILFGLDLSPLFASAGIIGVAIGFGSQSLVKDFLSGVFIISENQYRVGDIVEIMGSSGKVERVGTRSTVLRDIEGNVHYIPNGTIQRVINKTMGYGVSRFIVSLPPDVDMATATEMIDSVGQELAKSPKWKSKIIEPPKFSAVENVSGQSIDLVVSGKTMPSDQWDVASEMKRRLLQAFSKKDIELLSTSSTKK